MLTAIRVLEMCACFYMVIHMCVCMCVDTKEGGEMML